jgi:hypothetical protein
MTQFQNRRKKFCKFATITRNGGERINIHGDEGLKKVLPTVIKTRDHDKDFIQEAKYKLFL